MWCASAVKRGPSGHQSMAGLAVTCDPVFCSCLDDEWIFPVLSKTLVHFGRTSRILDTVHHVAVVCVSPLVPSWGQQDEGVFILEHESVIWGRLPDRS